MSLREFVKDIISNHKLDYNLCNLSNSFSNPDIIHNNEFIEFLTKFINNRESLRIKLFYSYHIYNEDDTLGHYKEAQIYQKYITEFFNNYKSIHFFPFIAFIECSKFKEEDEDILTNYFANLNLKKKRKHMENESFNILILYNNQNEDIKPLSYYLSNDKYKNSLNEIYFQIVYNVNLLNDNGIIMNNLNEESILVKEYTRQKAISYCFKTYVITFYTRYIVIFKDFTKTTILNYIPFKEDTNDTLFLLNLLNQKTKLAFNNMEYVATYILNLKLIKDISSVVINEDFIMSTNPLWRSNCLERYKKREKAITIFPPEIRQEIFSYLKPNEMGRIKQVSKQLEEDIKQIENPTIEDLIHVVIKGNEEAIKYLIDEKKILEKLDPSINDNELIIESAKHGNEKMTKLLLQDSRVDPSAQDNIAIIKAVQNGHVNIVELFLKDSRVDPTVQTNEIYQNSLSTIAAMNGHINMVELLLKDSRVDPSVHESDAIMIAVRHKHFKVAEILLQDPRVDPSRQKIVIVMAVRNGRINMVELLLKDSRVDPSVNDNDAIVEAARFGYEEILELLLKDSRVDPSAQNNYAIRFAVKNEHEKMVKLLLKDPRVDPSARYNEAIVTVAKNGNEKIVELLLKDLRVDPSAHDNEAIFYSILYNHEKVAELLLKDSRMELSKKNSHLLLRAVENGYDTVIELLLKNYPIDPTVQDNYALSYAVENGYVKAVELLLKDPRVILYANKSRTFLQTIYSAIKNNHVKIVELLINESKTSKIIKDALIIAKKYNKGDIVKILEAKLKKSL